MVKRQYWLSGISAIAEDKRTDTAHHSIEVNVELTRVGRCVQNVARFFKGKSLWLDM